MEDTDMKDVDLEELEYQISCGVCLDPFDDPRTLMCSHSICNHCLSDIYRRNPSCPFCRSPFGLPFPLTNQQLLDLTQRYLDEVENKKSGKKNPNNPNPNPLDAQDSCLLWLPKEVLFEIYTHMTYRDFGRLTRVCKSLQTITENAWLWREYCNQLFPFCDADAGKTWRSIFLVHIKCSVGWDRGSPKDFKMTPWRAHTNYINCFDMYRRNVVSGGADNDLNFWAYGNAKPLRTLKGHTALINTIKFNEIWVASGSSDNTVRIWDTNAGTTIRTLPHTGAVNSLYFNDHMSWTSSTDRHVRCWDLRNGNNTMDYNVHASAVQKVEPGPNTTLISYDTNQIKVLDTRNNVAPLHNINANGITCGQYAGLNRYVFGTNTGQLKVYDVSSGTELHSNQLHHQRINCLHAEGDAVVTGSQDSTLKLWNMKTASLVHTLADHTGPINSVQMDEWRIVSGASDMCMKVWKRETGARLYSLLGGSLQERGKNPPHPSKPGCSALKFDRSRIVASFNSLLRVYSFTVEH